MLIRSRIKVNSSLQRSCREVGDGKRIDSDLEAGIAFPQQHEPIGVSTKKKPKPWQKPEGPSYNLRGQKNGGRAYAISSAGGKCR